MMASIYGNELTFTPWAIWNFLRGLQMDVLREHPLGSNSKAFLEGVRPQTYQKLVEEILILSQVPACSKGPASERTSLIDGSV